VGNEGGKGDYSSSAVAVAVVVVVEIASFSM